MDFEATRLCPAIGAEISGLDVSDVSGGNLIGGLRQAVNEAGGLLVLQIGRAHV